MDAPVARVLVDGDRACGVVLESGEEIAAHTVISNADPHRTFIDLLGAEHLDTGFVRRIKNIRLRGVSAKLNLALDALPSLHVYAHPRPFQPIPFHVWGFDADEAPSTPGANAVFLPIGPSDGLTLSFDLRDPDCGCRHEALTPLDPAFCADHMVARFALDGAPRRLKLRRGLYLVGWGGREASTRTWWKGIQARIARPGSEAAADPPGALYSHLTRPRGGSAEPLAYLLFCCRSITLPTPSLRSRAP